MKQTVVGVFESALGANEAVHVLVAARFDAERLPRIERGAAPAPHAASPRLLQALARKWRDFMDADMCLQPYASALARGRFVVKVYTDDDPQAHGARRILEAAGAKDIDFLADEWVDGGI